jgi:hypothetical protein
MTAPTPPAPGAASAAKQGQASPTFVSGLGNPRPELGGFDQYPAEAVNELYSLYKQLFNASMTAYLQQHAAQQPDLDFGKLTDFSTRLLDFIWGTDTHVGTWGFLTQRLTPDELRDFSVSRRIAACEHLFVTHHAIKLVGEEYVLYDSGLQKVGVIPHRAAASLTRSSDYYERLKTYAQHVKDVHPDVSPLLSAFLPCPDQLQPRINPTRVFGAVTLKDFLESAPVPESQLRQDPPRATFRSDARRELYLLDAPQLSPNPDRAYRHLLLNLTVQATLADLYRNEGFAFLQPDSRKTLVDDTGRAVFSYQTLRSRYDLLARTTLPLSFEVFQKVIQPRLTPESVAKMVSEMTLVHATLSAVYLYGPELHRVALVNPDTGQFTVGALPSIPPGTDLTPEAAASAYIDTRTVERVAAALARDASAVLDGQGDRLSPLDATASDVFGLSSLRFTSSIKDAMDSPDLSIYAGFFRAMPRDWSDTRTMHSPYYGAFAQLLSDQGVPRQSRLFAQLCNRHALLGALAEHLRGR